MKVKLRVKVEQSIRARVRRGARALDKVTPDWFRQSNIRLSRLDQTNGCECVWGQLRKSLIGNEAFEQAFYAGPDWAHESLGYYPGADEVFVSPECHNYPETLPDVERRAAIQDEEWSVLQDEWEKQIRIRRRAAGLRAAA